MSRGRPDEPLAGKVALVTGANRGIGRVIAGSIGAAGAAVAGAARDLSSLDGVADDVRTAGASFLPLECDVARPGSVAAMTAAVVDAWGHVDVVVANAGTTGPVRALHELADDEWRECIVTNLDSVFLTFRGFLPGMIAQQSGSLIAISSMTGKRPLANRSPYCAAKMGVIGLVRSLALELGPAGIRVNSVCPGAVEGDRLRWVVRKQAQDQNITESASRALFTDEAPLKRAVRPEEVAATCVFLASDAGAGITGEDVNVSAGLVMF